MTWVHDATCSDLWLPTILALITPLERWLLGFAVRCRLMLRCELFQLGVDPPFWTRFLDQMCIELFEHVCDPEQALLYKVKNHVNESTDVCCSGQQRTAMRILPRL